MTRIHGAATFGRYGPYVKSVAGITHPGFQQFPCEILCVCMGHNSLAFELCAAEAPSSGRRPACASTTFFPLTRLLCNRLLLHLLTLQDLVTYNAVIASCERISAWDRPAIRCSLWMELHPLLRESAPTKRTFQPPSDLFHGRSKLSS